jgi:hypothetical protein
MIQAAIAALPAIASGAGKVAAIANGVMTVNDAIKGTRDTIDKWNNKSTEDTRSGGEASASQGHRVPPISF